MAIPAWWKPTPLVRHAIAEYLRVKADFDAFDGDRRGIAAALTEREFGILRAFVNEHFEDDEGDHGIFAVSVMVKALIAALPVPSSKEAT